MFGRIRVECIDTHILVIGTRGQELASWGESDSVYGTRVVAHRGKLLRLVVGGIGGIVDGLGRPDPHIAV
jgi:hypothetical protein